VRIVNGKTFVEAPEAPNANQAEVNAKANGREVNFIDN